MVVNNYMNRELLERRRKQYLQFQTIIYNKLFQLLSKNPLPSCAHINILYFFSSTIHSFISIQNGQKRIQKSRR